MSIAGVALQGRMKLHEPCVKRIALSDIDVSERTWRVREWAEDVDIELLAASIRQRGDLDVPLTVRSAPEQSGYSYELILGMRRLLAAEKAGLSHVLVFICDVDDTEALAAAIRADTSSRQLSTLERGWALVRLRSQWDPDVYGPYEQQQLAARVGATASTVSEAIGTAEAIPRALVETASRHAGIPVAYLSTLQRKAVRRVRRSPADELPSVLERVAGEIAKSSRDLGRALSADEVTKITLDTLKQTKEPKEDAASKLITISDHGHITLDLSRPIAEWPSEQQGRLIELLDPLLEDARRCQGETTSDARKDSRDEVQTGGDTLDLSRPVAEWPAEQLGRVIEVLKPILDDVHPCSRCRAASKTRKDRRENVRRPPTSRVTGLFRRWCTALVDPVAWILRRANRRTMSVHSSRARPASSQGQVEVNRAPP